MRKILYIANHRLPTEKAYGIQISKMCEAFADLDYEIVLVVPYRISKVKEDFFRYYDVRKNFKFKKIFTPDFYLPGKLDKIAFGTKYFFSAIVLAIYALVHKADITYSRDEIPLYLLSFFRKNLVFEIHNFSKKRTLFYKRLKNKKVKVVAISGGIKRELEKIGFDPQNILVAFDAVDLRVFDIGISKTEARSKLNLPLDQKIVIYAGHLFEWKGADTLIKAASILKEALFVFVGGADKEVARNILFLGHKPHKEIPLYLKAADVLILPNKKDEKISELYTSPLKLFEYMASKRPIVASDLPSMREVLDDESCVFFESGNPEKLAQGIEKVMSDENLAESISAKAFEKVQNYTWRKRALKILDFIK